MPRHLPLAAALVAAAALATPRPAVSQEARRRWDVQRQIRLDKFDLVLPGAMRDTGLDMWIVAMRENHYDPLWEDLGGGFVSGIGYFVFTDRGGDRIERAVLGIDTYLPRQSGYDIVGSAADLAAFVRERDPRRIGVNVSDEIGPADGLTHTLYAELQTTLGDPYAGRMTSAEKLAAEFRYRRVALEVSVAGEAATLAATLAERAFSNEVITPGRTTLADVMWWLQDRLLERGLESEFGVPSIYITGPDGIEAVSTDRVIQRGDILMIDWGIRMMNLATDSKRMAYVLKDGETEVPAGILAAFDTAVTVRDVIRRHIRVGRRADETLAELNAALDAVGFRPVAFNQPSAGSSIDVTIGAHPIGNTGHGIGPSMTTWQPRQSTWTLEPGHLFSLEFFTWVPQPEWNGRKLRIPLEDDALLTERGVEWIAPANRRVLVIK